MFITFEGIEGSGKSTQINLWRQHLEQLGRHVIVTKEPGGSIFGQQIRSILLDPETHLMDHRTELLLFTADRLEHLAQVIKPALQNGHTVLCDRFIDSTFAYQMAGRQTDLSLVNQLCEMIDCMPTKTILYDLPVELGLSRAKQRAALDRFEQESIAFHESIRSCYLSRATAEPNRFFVIDVAHLTPEQVFKKSCNQVKLTLL